MDTLHSRISLIVNNRELSDAEKLLQIERVLAEAAAVLTAGIVERLVAALKTRAGFAYVNQGLTSENCPTVAEPSLEGARLEEKILGSRSVVRAKLKELGLRSATVAEGLLYALTHPEELRADSWIWCFEQVVLHGANGVLVLHIANEWLCATLEHVSVDVRAGDRVLCFPMTPAEIADRDAEVAEQRNV